MVLSPNTCIIYGNSSYSFNGTSLHSFSSIEFVLFKTKGYLFSLYCWGGLIGSWVGWRNLLLIFDMETLKMESELIRFLSLGLDFVSDLFSLEAFISCLYFSEITPIATDFFPSVSFGFCEIEKAFLIFSK